MSDQRYEHRQEGGGRIDLPPGKVVCVGRNYAAHARELNNPVPEQPLLFIKPTTSLVSLTGAPWALPSGRGACHHELELALLIRSRLRGVRPEEVDEGIWGYGLGLDLTLRDLQGELKAKGHPWERAKAFDGSCPLSPFVHGVVDWSALALRLEINGEVRQAGTTADMLTPVRELVAHISESFTLEPGDVVLTGTPAGVGPLASGDRLVCALEGHGRWEAQIAVGS